MSKKEQKSAGYKMKKWKLEWIKPEGNLNEFIRSDGLEPGMEMALLVSETCQMVQHHYHVLIFFVDNISNIVPTTLIYYIHKSLISHNIYFKPN